MNRAELAAEVLRIYDLIAAEPGPRGDEWNEIATHMTKAARAVPIIKFDESRQGPQPRMVDGVGLCSVHCPHHFRDDYTEGCKHGGNGAVARLTRSMVPCRPWVDATLQHCRDVNEAQANAWQREVDGLRQAQPHRHPSAAPCEFAMPSIERCGDWTVCRSHTGLPLCRAHGGRQPGEVR